MSAHVVWGAPGENCARYLTKGRPIAVDGHLDWREYEAHDHSRRQAVQIIADTVQFLGNPERATNDAPPPMVAHTAPVDDDIPF